MFRDLFSKRNQPEPGVLKYDIPSDVRPRIFQAMEMFTNRGLFNYNHMLRDVYEQCLLRYNGFEKQFNDGPYVPRDEDPRTIQMLHYAEQCPTEGFVDFLEMAFREVINHYAGNQCIETINGIFRDDGIGFELSEFAQRPQGYLPPQNHGMGAVNTGKNPYIIYPIVTKKSDNLIHSTVAMPALHVLNNLAFTSASAELLKAHEHYRKGESVAAINSAGQAYESVFKIICDRKKWQYDPKAPLAPLVEVCRANALFEPFYVEGLKAPGSVRNNLGSHGQGNKNVTVTPDQAEHMIHLVSTNILLLTRLAKL